MARFRATLHLGGKTATGIQVPDEVVAGLGSGKRPAVSVTINGYTYRSTVAPMGGEFWIPVSAEVREKSGVAAGETAAADHAKGQLAAALGRVGRRDDVKRAVQPLADQCFQIARQAQRFRAQRGHAGCIEQLQ